MKSPGVMQAGDSSNVATDQEMRTVSFNAGEERWLRGVDVYVSSVGHGVQWDTVTEHHIVLVHCAMRQYTIILISPCPTEHRVPLNPRMPLSSSSCSSSSSIDTRRHSFGVRHGL